LRLCKVEYYLKWKGYPTEENSWVTGEDARYVSELDTTFGPQHASCRYMQDLIEDFHAVSSDEK
jgi:hypothetical protein